MSYQALYRVWRPQRFADLVGQHVITETLKNTIITNQISHAYLFSGPRGTGKTSAAKIFAKAVNCPNVKDGEPCNECKICKSITNGTLNDVIEIDAASNNGVDEIRDIRDKAKYAPTEATYKVYIIDEVHMLSTGAFNALLKTLEEPPANVIFILATTEPHKLPATIISRTQRFDFKRIQPKDILERMEYILNQKSVKYDDRALKVIAKAAEGGMRDALSILDQTMSYGDDVVTYDNALQVTGSVTTSLLFQYVSDVFNQDVKAALVSVRKIMDEGKDAGQFIEDLISYYQNILLYKQAPEMLLEQELGIVNDQFKQLAERVDSNIIYQIIENLNDIQQQMRYTMHPDVYLEVLTVKIATLSQNNASSSVEHNENDQHLIQNLSVQINDLKQQINQLKQQQMQQSQNNQNSQPVNAASTNNQQNNKIDVNQKTIKVNLSKIYPILDSATKEDLVRVRSAWTELVQKMPIIYKSLLSIATPVAASSSGVVVSFGYDFFYQRAVNDRELDDIIGKGFNQFIGYTPNLAYVSENQWPKVRHDYYTRSGVMPNENSNPSSAAPKSAAVKDDLKPANDSLNSSSADDGVDDLAHQDSQVAATVQQSSSNSESQVATESDSNADVVEKAIKTFGSDILDIKDD